MQALYDYLTREADLLAAVQRLDDAALCNLRTYLSSLPDSGVPALLAGLCDDAASERFYQNTRIETCSPCS